MSHESRLERHSAVLDLSAKITANLTVGTRNGQYRPFNGSGRGQVCMKFGHTAVTYHYRFDGNWITRKASTAQPQANLTEQSLDYDPQAFLAQSVPDFGDDVGWYVDSGATNHIAHSLDNLESVTPFTG
uniref:Uncharacterized protein n=1 Tax=Cannabis sativa TaxID=3483 RepID=A0A803QAP9_CANSA